MKASKVANVGQKWDSNRIHLFCVIISHWKLWEIPPHTPFPTPHRGVEITKKEGLGHGLDAKVNVYRITIILR